MTTQLAESGQTRAQSRKPNRRRARAGASRGQAPHRGGCPATDPLTGLRARCPTDAGVPSRFGQPLARDDTQMSAPVLTLHLLSAEERACPHTTYVREPASQTTKGGDGRLKLIERLAAAYRAAELPDYMLEFVDSLRTRAKQPTS
jgi:hypothetical protein